MEVLDSVFKVFFYQICNIAKWIFAIKMATSIIKNAGTSDIQSIMRELLAGAFSYGALYAIISILDKVQASFN